MRNRQENKQIEDELATYKDEVSKYKVGVDCALLFRIYNVLLKALSEHARLAQLVEHQTFNLRVKGSSPLSGAYFWARPIFLFCMCICTM